MQTKQSGQANSITFIPLFRTIPFSPLGRNPWGKRNSIYFTNIQGSILFNSIIINVCNSQGLDGAFPYPTQEVSKQDIDPHGGACFPLTACGHSKRQQSLDTESTGLLKCFCCGRNSRKTVKWPKVEKYLAWAASKMIQFYSFYKFATTSLFRKLSHFLLI